MKSHLRFPVESHGNPKSEYSSSNLTNCRRVQKLIKCYSGEKLFFYMSRYAIREMNEKKSFFYQKKETCRMPSMYEKC